MRVTFGTKYNQMTNNQGALAQKLNDVNAKIASGLKIQHGWQDSSINNQNLKLEYDETTLNQGIDISKTAHTNTLNTDQALKDISETMNNFKVKLVQAANEVHTPTSREAIARDLESLKQHIINVGNTSIGGNFIFSGSKVSTMPLDNKGRYHGNDEDLRALISSENLVPFNVTGEELFYKSDNDRYKKITTNVPLLNQSKLHPDVMNLLDQNRESKEIYITENDTLRDLVGDSDHETNKNKKEYFYINGVKSNGESFKAKFELDIGYSNIKSATKVRDLLDRIGQAFGNTNATKVVEIRLNQWGQIEIKDLKNGSSSIDFHMISSNVNVDDVSSLEAIGANIKKYNTQNLPSAFSTSTLSGTNNLYDNRITHLLSTFVTKDNSIANEDTKLNNILDDKVRYIEISGNLPNTKDGKINNSPSKPPFIFSTENKTLGDLVNQIKNYFGGNIDVDIDNGSINIYDKNVKSKNLDYNEPPFNGERGFSIKLTTLDQNGFETTGFNSLNGIKYAKTGFRKEGKELKGNVAQVISGTSKMAKEEDTLKSVVHNSLNNTNYILKVNDHNGFNVDAKIEFTPNGTFLRLPFKNQNENEMPLRGDILVPIFSPTDIPARVSNGDEITYRQLMDAMSIALNYSNEDIKSYVNTEINGMPTKENKKAYEELLHKAKFKLDINLDDDGKIVINDKLRSKTRMNIMLYDENISNFSEQSINEKKGVLRINANTAITIDDPKISFFSGLDEAIEAVRSGINRAGALNENRYTHEMSNRGIQNSIELIDHLSDHVEKVISKNGAHSRTFENAITRNEVIKNQVNGIKGETIGADIAETYNKFSNLSNNYQAVLSSTNKINQMSLVNYLR